MLRFRTLLYNKNALFFNGKGNVFIESFFIKYVLYFWGEKFKDYELFSCCLDFEIGHFFVEMKFLFFKLHIIMLRSINTSNTSFDLYSLSFNSQVPMVNKN